MTLSRFARLFSPARSAAVAWLLSLAAAPGAEGYDPPKFDQRLFDADALSLGSAEMGEIVTALTALASNFPDQAIVDGDVREKALALALGLRPLDEGARSAHRALMSGSPPATIELFQSLSAISSALWRHGERLAAPGGEPEDRRLAPLLMELALLVQPGGAPPKRLRAFQLAAEEAPPQWDRVVVLQLDVNASNRRAAALFRPITEPESPPARATVAAVPSPRPPMPMPTPPDGNPSNSAGGPSDLRPVSEVKRREGSIAYIGRDEISGEAVAGVATFAVREPTQDETSLFGLFTDQETRRTFEMRLTYDREGATVSGIDLVEPFVRQKYPRWPLQLLAEFGFHPDADSGESRQVDLSLPALILLTSAFSGDEIADAFAPGGEYALAGGLTAAGGTRLPRRPVVADYVLAAGKTATPPKVLFIPAAGDDTGPAASLTEVAIDGEPALLFRPQVIGYSSVEDLRPVLSGQAPEALLTAINDFAAIQTLTEKMEFGAIARNEVVRGRLETVLETWPGHVSARALLDYGARPADAGMSLTGSVKAIDAALEPVIEIHVARENGEGFVVSTAAEAITAARATLSGLRLKIDPLTKPYLTAAENTLEAGETYLSLTNLGTSIAQQRHRELQERIVTWKQERAKLGVGDADR